MHLLGLAHRPIWFSVVAFAVAAFFVWGAGTRISRYLGSISDLTGIGGGFLGLVLLGSITSLPEAATVTTASIAGDAPLAVNNLLGSAAINIVLLAVADAFLGPRALTSVIGAPTPLLQGVLSVLVLAFVVVGITAGDVAIAGVGMWSLILVGLYFFSVWLTSKYQHRRPWQPAGDAGSRKTSGNADESGRSSGGEDQARGGSIVLLTVKSTAAALVILAAGFVLAQSGSAIAQKTGIGSGLIGLVLVGFATSLPELSSIRSAMQEERYRMVLGDIFGTNIFNLTLIFLADLFFAGPPVLGQSGPFEAVATLLAMILTCIYLIGLLERQDKTLWRMGYGSVAVVIVYVAGLGLLFRIAPSG